MTPPRRTNITYSASMNLSRCIITAFILAAPSLLSAQKSGELPQRATRSQLQERLVQLDAELGQAKREQRARLQSQATIIRARLESGDFQSGDRFVVTLRQDSVRIDTASVRDSLKVSLFSLPDFSVAGVLRSELDSLLRSHVSRYLRNANVRANVLTRISINGAVRTPGFYYSAPDRPLSDLLMLAGGPAPEARLNEVEVYRGAVKLLSAKDSRRVLKDGTTLEQLDIRAGDEVRIPAKAKRISFQSVLQIFFVFSTLFFAVLQFLQWYYTRQDG
jgi:hypothetical protein